MVYADLKILVVDDMSVMRTILKSLLNNMGIKDILEAADGEIALQILQQNKIDLILSDWNMPKMSGIELLRRVREDILLQNIPFVMISAEATSENLAQAIRLHVSQYLIKPVSAAQLEQKIYPLLTALANPARTYAAA
ncbi:MAG: response regulator [Desulfobulbaceae bacterium]|nr:response regulator [Desulfobulbaceae bacterium]